MRIRGGPNANVHIVRRIVESKARLSGQVGFARSGSKCIENTPFRVRQDRRDSMLALNRNSIPLSKNPQQGLRQTSSRVLITARQSATVGADIP